jgi:signal transduction histidine kinase
MGIGAFESREYIREIGGSLAVTSTEGGGSCFSIRLRVHGETSTTSPERTADVR